MQKLSILTGMLFLSVVVLFAGCGDKDEYEPMYNSPGEGHTAGIILLHTLGSSAQYDETWASVFVKINDEPISGTEVFVNDILLPYMSNNDGYSMYFQPALNPSELYRIRVRSQVWGEDSTFVRLPGRFSVTGVDENTVWQQGSTVSFGWTDALYADNYSLSYSIIYPDCTYFSAVETEEGQTTLEWTVPEGDYTSVTFGIQAVNVLAADSVFYGSSNTKLYFEVPVE